MTLLVALQEMLDPAVSDEDAREAAEEDWAQDMANSTGTMMLFNQFFDSMFELCDTWVI